jgi:hypothetical protein
MVIIIAILGLIGMIINIFDNVYNHNKLDINLFFPAILTIIVWEANITLSIATIIVTVVISIINISNNN